MARRLAAFVRAFGSIPDRATMTRKFESIGLLEPKALEKESLCRFIGIGPKVLQRMIWASRHGDRWLDFASNHKGKPKLRVTFTVESARLAFERLRNGEEPPMLPSELRRKKGRDVGEPR
jgi:hypothetical protein